LALPLYDAAFPQFLQMLRNLKHFLNKAEAYAAANNLDLGNFIEGRLAPDMLALPKQIQIASDTAKGAAARLAGVDAPAYEDNETTFPELHARIDKTIAFIESVPREAINGGEDRPIELKFPNVTLNFTGANYILQFAQPNFMFHVTTAYGILRSKGVPLGKTDFLAGAQGRG